MRSEPDAVPRSVDVEPPTVAGLGSEVRKARADALDSWLAGLLPPVSGVALLAVGGLGRRECLHHGDLDLLLVHSGRPDVYHVADAVWYPIWDAGLGLDHAVRTVPEVLSIGGDDVKAALGLLDARYVAGDRGLAERVRAAVRVDWRRQAAARLAALREITEQRWERFGELAFAAEGDLKESRGGLRDVVALRGIGLAQLAPGPRDAVSAAYRRMLTVREALHACAGRRLDRLATDLTGSVAGMLVEAGSELDPAERVVPAPEGEAAEMIAWRRAEPALALRAQLADDARTISHAVTDAWRSVRRARTGRLGGRLGRMTRRPLDDGVVEQDGEVVLARAALAPERLDTALPVRAVAAAARCGLPVSTATLEWLSAACPAPSRPWPTAVRDAFLRLLDAGPGLVEAWESADRYGLITRWLPEWADVRNLPQPGPVHRHTVDRHLVQTVVCAAEHARGVERPDLLLVAALLHDIGKGSGADHAEVGGDLAEGIVRRMGLTAADVTVVGRLVRRHLLLPDTATRRDLADPVTIGSVAEAVGDTTTLDLLAALVRADATAAGPIAASSWRMELVERLVAQVRGTLRTGELPAPAGPSALMVELAGGRLPAVRVEQGEVTVVARAYPGLLAAVAGCLAANQLTVLSADVTDLPIDGSDESGEAEQSSQSGTNGADRHGAGQSDGVATVAVSCTVRPEFGRGPDPAKLAADLRRAVRGEYPVAQRVSARERGYAASVSPGPPPRVVWQDGAATGAVVLELRAADRIGLLYRVADALATSNVWVRAARISTLGAAAVDSFYLVGDWSQVARRREVTDAVLAAAAGPNQQSKGAR